VESGLNDPLAMMLTVAATEWVLGQSTGVAGAFGLFALQPGVGAAAAFARGRIGRWLLHAIPLPAAGIYPVITLALAFLSFGTATLAGGSGLLSVYLTGIVLAAGHLPYRAGVRRVRDSLAWLAQILMFLLLGLLVFPSRLAPALTTGLAVAAALAFVARPLAVLTVLGPFRGRRGASACSWPGWACAGRCRSCSRPTRCCGASRPATRSSTSSSSWWC
jgi:cell volume regulation protein A